jgi:L-asparaginase
VLCRFWFLLFQILHGTDTMAYTASALSFMLEHLGKAVILTGAMIPLSAPVSDAKRNLIVSLLCAVNLDIPEVCIFFNNGQSLAHSRGQDHSGCGWETTRAPLRQMLRARPAADLRSLLCVCFACCLLPVLLRGNRAKKLDPGTINPFDSPNFPPLAEMGVRISLRRELLLQAPRRKFTSHRTLFGNIAVMIMVPGFDDLALEAFLATSTAERPAVLVLLLYGAGNAPSAKKSFLDCLRKGVAEKGAVVVILSQCLHGTVDMAQYG